jgi:hypothetical protein
MPHDSVVGHCSGLADPFLRPLLLRFAGSLIQGTFVNFGSTPLTGANWGNDNQWHQYELMASDDGSGFVYSGTSYGTARYELGLPTMQENKYDASCKPLSLRCPPWPPPCMIDYYCPYKFPLLNRQPVYLQPHVSPCGGLDSASPCGPPPPPSPPNCVGCRAMMSVTDKLGWIWSPFTFGASEGVAKEINILNEAGGPCD